MSHPQATQALFSYGTLQLEQVQLATFGRKLDTRPDVLAGYRLEQLEIHDPEVIRTSGKRHHPIIRASGNPADSVAGAVLLLTDAELQAADGYEVAAYSRVAVQLVSGRQAWVYAAAPQPAAEA
ncbi:gamma-glutamylcyclotransferase family protein [Vogesella facilis]|uniref:Gamma-glutamylcyclotransferase family protein n=1 Tax=Vogesella facilis TaxID=1655232 RepID=A0ABV7R8X7_9NEIS